MSRHRVRRGRGKKMLLIAFRVLLLLIIVSIIQQNVVIGVKMHGNSMNPTFNDRDTVYGSKLIYTFTQRTFRSLFAPSSLPSYGDVVYIRFPYDVDHSWLAVALDGVVRFFTLQRVTTLSEPRLVRRVVALPGDTVRMRDFQFFCCRSWNKDVSE